MTGGIVASISEWMSKVSNQQKSTGKVPALQVAGKGWCGYSLPLRVQPDQCTEGRSIAIIDAKGNVIARSPEANEYDCIEQREIDLPKLERLVVVANAHDDLVAVANAARRVLGAIDRMKSSPADGLAEDLRDALAKAELRDEDRLGAMSRKLLN